VLTFKPSPVLTAAVNGGSAEEGRTPGEACLVKRTLSINRFT
jgi:hypothetical protein